jgi:hypothetical protein
MLLRRDRGSSDNVNVQQYATCVFIQFATETATHCVICRQELKEFLEVGSRRDFKATWEHNGHTISYRQRNTLQVPLFA